MAFTYETMEFFMILKTEHLFNTQIQFVFLTNELRRENLTKIFKLRNNYCV